MIAYTGSPIPLLIISDAPSCTSGLGRITRDLATRIANGIPEFRCATFGYGGPGSWKLPFPQYNAGNIAEWVLPDLQRVWEDFAGNQRGVIMTIWDASRLKWFARPREASPIPQLAEWLDAAPFERWGYWPIDAEGPNRKLSSELGKTIAAYDRNLAYSQWAADIIGRTNGSPVPSLPHGLDTSVWYPREKMQARSRFREMGFHGLTDDTFLVGVVATNQARKDFGLAFETCAKLLESGKNVRMWVHTDILRRYWDLVALATDFGMLGRVVITTNSYSDEEMATMYSACDVTLGIGLGEGWGLPLDESLACGVPVIHGDYGGAPERLPEVLKVHPESWRLEGQFNCLRPVFSARRWAIRVHAVSVLPDNWGLPEGVDWNTLWPRWKEWLLKGVSRG